MVGFFYSIYTLYFLFVNAGFFTKNRKCVKLKFKANEFLHLSMLGMSGIMSLNRNQFVWKYTKYLYALNTNKSIKNCRIS